MAYQHQFFMLIDELEFMYQPENGDGDMEFDDLAWREFKEEALKQFKADEIRQYKDREAVYFGETDRLLVGLDYSGGMPALFVEPKTYCRGVCERKYQIAREVKRAFNKLIQAFNCFYWPTTAWTVEKLARY